MYNPTSSGHYHHWHLRVFLNGIEAGWSQAGPAMKLSTGSGSKDGYDIATVNGIATADTNGEMTFEPLEQMGTS